MDWVPFGFTEINWLPYVISPCYWTPHILRGCNGFGSECFRPSPGLILDLWTARPEILIWSRTTKNFTKRYNHLLNFTHIINLIISYIYHSRTYSHKIYLYQVGDLAMQPVNSCASPSSCPSGATSLAPAPLSSRYTSAPKMHHLPCCS